MLIIGLMSGTSGDGIDAALCEITGEPPHLAAQILKGITVPYEDTFRQRILAACKAGTVDELCQLNFDLGYQFAAAAQQVMGNHTVDLIASHGQTVWHQVNSDGRVTSTLQIGEAAVIAEETGITTISNFRTRDVAVGGQGAPLTAYADWLLLRHPEHWRAVQNIGGMGNVTFLPPTSLEAAPLAFDTGPGNALIDAAVYQLTGQPYDLDGKLAQAGKVDAALLAELLDHPYFKRQPPKTTGRELFGTAMAQGLIEKYAGVNLIATLTALTAHSIADAYQRFAPHPPDEVILGGGGSRNPTLIAMLKMALQERHIVARVMTHEDIGLDSDFKEALVFALLAYETWHNRPGNLPALTGAQKPVILGQITPGK